MKKIKIITDEERERYKERMDKRSNKEVVRWQNWREAHLNEKIEGISETSSDIIMSYLTEMSVGINISSKNCKGPRSPRRLNDLKDRLIIFSKWLNERYGMNNIGAVTEAQLFLLFHDLKNGIIKTQRGEAYKSLDTLAKAFKAFWHWWMKANRKKNIIIEDITQDLDARCEKPDWVYLSEEQCFQLAESASFEYRVLIHFLLDTGLRPPLELLPLKVSDVSEENGVINLNIRIHKKGSFSRKIKLINSGKLLKEYIKATKKKPNDFLFQINPDVVNRNLKKLALKLFGDEITLAGHKISQLTMYDLRHNACCYWIKRYPSESGIKYRFGWKKSDKIHYYSELLGMQDTITEGDILLDITKTELENKMKKVEQENLLLKEKIENMNEWLKQIDLRTKQVEAMV